MGYNLKIQIQMQKILFEAASQCNNIFHYADVLSRFKVAKY